MKKESIKLNSEVSVDLEKLIEGGMVILANSGGGKSYLIRRIAEQSVNKVQTIIIDPEGEFSSLREKYDFILAGKDADVPAEPRSAALLATKLLELNKSAVIDLYELHPQERQRFVKLFCDALVNAPKNLYHPVLIILDEAHEYVPEGKPSEATWAVESLASKGRKRGQRLILASQRIAKISKNVTAEANNKLIGRASQDIDMKRAGDELGFNKESLKQLRQLRPGEFFAFGPAISDEVIKLKIGEVKTHHAKVGYKGVGKIPPASDVIKKVLAGLKDLPKEAEKEAKDIKELQQRLSMASRELARMGKEQSKVDPKFYEKGRADGIKAMETTMRKEFDKQISTYKKEYTRLISVLKQVSQLTKPFSEYVISINLPKIEIKNPEIKRTALIKHPDNSVSEYLINEDQIIDDKPLGQGHKKVLNAIAQYPDGMTTEHLAVLTGYKSTSRSVYTQYLTQHGFIQKTPNGFIPTEAGIRALGDDFKPLPEGEELREHLLQTLPEGEKRVFSAILEDYSEDGISKDEIMNRTGYKSTSVSVYVQRLAARKAVMTDRGIVRVNEKLLF